MTLFAILLLFGLIFGAVFLLGFALAGGGAGQNKQALSRLDAIAMSATSEEEAPLDLRREDPLSAIPWLDSLLKRLDIAPKLRLLMYQAGLKWSAGRLFLSSFLLALLTAYAVYLRTKAVPLGLLIGGGCGLMPLLYVLWKRNSRFDKIRQILPEALDTMVAAIRAGHSFNSALGMAARETAEPVKSELRLCFDEQNFGLDLRSSMKNLEMRTPIHEIRIVVAGIVIQRETGGNLTEILERTAYLIREDFRLRRQVKVHTAQGRMTGWILSLLPPILGLLLYLLNPNHMSLLWTRSLGVKLLYASGVMTTIGALIIRKIVNIRI